MISPRVTKRRREGGPQDFGLSDQPPIRPERCLSRRLGPTAGLLARGSAPRPAFPAARSPPVAYSDETTRLQLRGQLRIRNSRSAPHSLFALSRETVEGGN